MLADHAYRIGSTHDVCEDYASSALDTDVAKGHAYAVTTDGCSICLDADGNPDPEARTDVGAALLNLAACELLRRPIHDLRGLHQLILAKACLSIGSCGLGSNSLASTLLMLQSSGPVQIVSVCGDGVVAARNRITGLWRVHEFDFVNTDNVKAPPYYLFYELNPEDRNRYFEHEAQILQESSYMLEPSGVVETEKELRNFPLGMTWPYCRVLQFPKAAWDIVLLFSDGIQTYRQGKHGAVFSTPLAISQFLTLPEKPNGRFLFKRLRQVERDNLRDGVIHEDDVSVSGVYSGGG